jgi:ABC-2 type transport system ATP-binding protein
MQPISVSQVVKTYGNTTALNGVDLEVKPGEIFGLIGPDGAGKTSLMRIIVSLIEADSGTVLFMGKDVSRHSAFVRSRIGYMPQRFSLYQDLTVNENMRFFGDLFKVPAKDQGPRMEELYGFSKLGPFKDRRAGALSGGMKQKLALSCMLMHEPEVMILDEPTFGVDPVSRLELWEILFKLRERGKTLVVSTPYMNEAGKCNRIALMHNGRILAMDTPAKILENFDCPVYSIKTENPHVLYHALKEQLPEKNIQLFADSIILMDHLGWGSEKIDGILNELKFELHAEKSDPVLENVFLDLMNER